MISADNTPIDIKNSFVSGNKMASLLSGYALKNYSPARRQLNIALSTLMTLGILISGHTIAVSSDSNQLEHLQAARYTHLKWRETGRIKTPVKLLSIVNYSGIPIEAREEKADYFSYGKLPLAMNNIWQDVFIASRYFSPSEQQADYQMQLILDEYQLPYEFAADDHWWQKLHDQTDRWLQPAANSRVSLTLQISSGRRTIEPWTSSIQMSMTDCDLNQFPQPRTWRSNQDQLIKRYLSTTPGQTFLAAVNYLTLKAIQRLEQQPEQGRVSGKYGGEVYLTAEQARFTRGETVDLYYRDSQHSASAHAPVAGQLKIIKTSPAKTVAYPVNLRSDHIKVGDYVEVSKSGDFHKPASVYQPTTKCAPVESAQID